MPCFDNNADIDESQMDSFATAKLQRERDFLEASLCSILRILESSKVCDGPILQKILEEVDWKEAGITERQLYNWWNQHKKKDKERHIREQVQARRNAIKKTALAKLTDEERRALGI